MCLHCVDGSSQCNSAAALPRQSSDTIDVLNEDVAASCKEALLQPRKELFDGCVHQVKAFLANQPLQEWVDSMFFHRYLQWKWLERYVSHGGQRGMALWRAAWGR